MMGVTQDGRPYIRMIVSLSLTVTRTARTIATQSKVWSDLGTRLVSVDRSLTTTCFPLHKYNENHVQIQISLYTFIATKMPRQKMVCYVSKQSRRLMGIERSTKRRRDSITTRSISNLRCYRDGTNSALLEALWRYRQSCREVRELVACGRHVSLCVVLLTCSFVRLVPSYPLRLCHVGRIIICERSLALGSASKIDIVES
jgi:hypothetical protein